MNIIKKLINWLIHLMGGYTKKEFTDISAACGGLKKLYGMSENHLRIAENAIECWRGKYNALEKTLRTAESYITIDSALGYTADNVINESRQQTYYQLGKAVYPYAKHILTSDGKYICAVNVQEVDI